MIPTREITFDMEGHSNLAPTPTHSNLPLRYADFATLSEALDYAAEGDTGCNFYNKNGFLKAVLSYAQLRDEAYILARQHAVSAGCNDFPGKCHEQPVDDDTLRSTDSSG